jgi:hypothetical protein
MIGVEAESGCYASGWVGDLAPSDDPYAPAYWRVGVVRQYGWRKAGRDRDGNAPRSWADRSTLRRDSAGAMRRGA